MRESARRRAAAVARARRPSNQVSVEENDDAWKLLAGGGMAKSGSKVDHRTVMGYPPIWRGINLVVNDVAKVPLYLYERDDDDQRRKARSHSAYKLLLRQANRWQTAFQLRKQLTYHALLDGNGYGWIRRDQLERPLEIFAIVPTRTYPVVEEIGLSRRLWYVTHDADGEPIKLHPADVLHIKGLSYDGFSGHELVDLMREALGLGMAAREFATLFFGQGLNARGFLIVPNRLSEKEMSDLKDRWPRMNAGLKRSGLPAVLHGGLDFKPLTVDPDKAQALETRAMEIREAANIVGVRPHKVGDTTRTSFKSLEAEDAAHLSETVDPWFVSWEDEANFKLLTGDERERDSHYFEHDRDALIRVDAKTRGEILAKDREIGMASVNDGLRRQNRPPIGPEGDVHHVPSNWVPLQVPGEPEPEPPSDPEPPIPMASEAQTAANRRLVEHQLGLLLRGEADQVTRAANRDANFLAWMDRWYGPFERKLATALAPLVGVCRPLAEHPDRIAADLARAHAASSREVLLEAANHPAEAFRDRVTAYAAELPGAVRDQIADELVPSEEIEA